MFHFISKHFDLLVALDEVRGPLHDSPSNSFWDISIWTEVIGIGLDKQHEWKQKEDKN